MALSSWNGKQMVLVTPASAGAASDVVRVSFPPIAQILVTAPVNPMRLVGRGCDPKRGSRNLNFHRKDAKTLRKGRVLNSISYDQGLHQTDESCF